MYKDNPEFIFYMLKCDMGMTKWGKKTCTHCRKNLIDVTIPKSVWYTISYLDALCYNSEMDYYGISVYKRIILFPKRLTSIVLNLFLS